MINAANPSTTHPAVQCAQITQGASPRLRVATVSLVPADALVMGTSVSTFAKYGGQGSRAWSPPD
jgi:hypothetical protein